MFLSYKNLNRTLNFMLLFLFSISILKNISNLLYITVKKEITNNIFICFVKYSIYLQINISSFLLYYIIPPNAYLQSIQYLIFIVLVLTNLVFVIIFKDISYTSMELLILNCVLVIFSVLISIFAFYTFEENNLVNQLILNECAKFIFYLYLFLLYSKFSEVKTNNHLKIFNIIYSEIIELVTNNLVNGLLIVENNKETKIKTIIFDKPFFAFVDLDALYQTKIYKELLACEEKSNISLSKKKSVQKSSGKNCNEKNVRDSSTTFRNKNTLQMIKEEENEIDKRSEVKDFTKNVKEVYLREKTFRKTSFYEEKGKNYVTFYTNELATFSILL